MFSTNHNLEIEKYEEHYTAYGVCRCCLAKGQYRDVTKEYYYKNIKEVYKDIFLECFNFPLSSHIGISSLICDDCVLRLRDAASFHRMVAATEAQLLNAIVMSDPDTVTGIVSGIRQFTADVKKEIESNNQNDLNDEVLDDIQSILDNMPATPRNDDNLQMADINDDDNESPENELVIDDHVEYFDDNVPGIRHLTADEKKEIESVNQNDENNEVLEDIQSILDNMPATPRNDDNLQMADINDDDNESPEDELVIDDVEYVDNVSGIHQLTADVKKEIESNNQHDETDEVLEDILSILDNMPSTTHNGDNLQMANINDDDNDSPEEELVIDDDVEFVDDNDVYCRSVTRSTTSVKDDEPCAIVEGTICFVPRDSFQMNLPGRSPLPVQTEPKQTDLQVWPQNGDLKNLQDVYISSVSRSTTSAKDDEPCAIVEGTICFVPRDSCQMNLPGRSPLPVQTEPKRTDLQVWPLNDDLKKLEEQSLTADETVKSLELFFNIPGLKKDAIMTEKEVLARNATTIFKWSNASAFRPKVTDGYPCFFCRKVYKPDMLRKHQEKHKKSTIFNPILNYYKDVTYVMYADITNLKCTICEKNVRNLIDLRDHLTVQHSKKIYASVDRVIPFKLKGWIFDCQVCGDKFESFKKIEHHMKAHYGSYVCETCGNGFMTKHGLKLHNYSAHGDRKFICELCKDCFRTRKAYRMHCEVVHHQVKKYACSKCPEKFVCFYARRRHIFKEHDEEAKLYKCNGCGRYFENKSGLTIHKARCQKEQKFFKCGLCAYTCLTRIELSDHWIKHGGPPEVYLPTNWTYKCPVCRKLYESNKKMMKHLKKYHKEYKSCVFPNAYLLTTQISSKLE